MDEFYVNGLPSVGNHQKKTMLTVLIFTAIICYTCIQENLAANLELIMNLIFCVLMNEAVRKENNV